MTRSLGIDASATGTGLVLLEARPDDKSPAAFHEEVVKVKTKGMQRCSDIAERLLWVLDEFKPDTVAIEGYAPGRFIGSSLVSIEVGAVLRYFLVQRGVKYLEPAPTQVKKFVAGSGKAFKKEAMMMEVLHRWGHKSKDNNTADAYGLACMGLAHAGKLAAMTMPMREVIGTLKFV
jgi:crossover junction endodeoxyribonuclease RuvC